MLKDAATPFFDFLSTIIIKFPKTILLLTIFASSFSIAHVNKLTIDTSPQAFFHPDDPILLHYDQFLDQFERDEVAVIAIETDNVIAQEFLQLLSRLHEDLENNVPYVDEVISLINTTSIKGKADELIVEDLLEHWPQNKIELDRLRQDILSHPLYPKLLISDDARYTAVVVRAKAFSSDLVSSEDDLLAGFEDTHSNSSRKDYTKLSSKQNSEFGNKIIEISKKYETDTIRFYTAGLAIVNNELLIKLNAEVPLFTSFALFLIAIFLYLLFRRIGGVLMPLTVVLTALVTTIGYMAFFGKPFTVFTQILPSFLLAVGVGDAVHLLSIFYRDFAKTGDKLASLRHAMRHTGMAMFMTSITTAAGLLSFAVSEIAAIGYLGVFGALGVMLAFFYSIILLPTLIVLLPIKTKEVDNNGKLNLAIDNFISRLALISTRHPGSVILTSSFILVVALFGASQLRFHYDAVSWFPKDDPLRVATQVHNQAMDGAMYVEIVLDTGKTDGVKQVEFLQKLESLQQALLQMTGEENMYVGKTIAITDTIKLINQALNQNDPAFHTLPDTANLIAQELLLFENSGSDDLQALVDSAYSKTRLTLKLPWTSAGAYETFLDELRVRIDKHFNHEIPFVVTGMITLLTETSAQAIVSMRDSYLIAAVVISIMMILLLRSIRIGLIAMIPNLFPIVVALGFMGLLGFPLDLSSILVGSIAIGLSVDDTVHFMHHFKRYFNQCGDVVQAVNQTLHTAGRAMLVTTIVLSLGFFIFAFSDMNNLVSFGLVTGTTIIMALFADIFLAPALMAYTVKSKRLCNCLRR